MTLPLLALTPGEPAGIGPDICIKLAQHGLPGNVVVIADPDLLTQRARQLQLPLQLQTYGSDASVASVLPPATLRVLAVPLRTATTAGTLDVTNGHYVMQTLQRAVDGCLAGEFKALCTGPVHKGVINDAGYAFTGHTEFLADQSKVKRVVMMLATSKLRVALATTHLPLSQVAATITADLLEAVLVILHDDLQRKFGIASPRIIVAGLNPHAGEGGHLGREEIDIIAPVIGKLRSSGMQLTGPLPADTLFTPRHLEHADAVLAMYHDQGLPVLKYQGFGEAVNHTLGLPFIRTSVDHGTALDLAGTGRADTGSLAAALQAAQELLSTLS